MDAVLQLSQTQRVQLFERTAQLTGMEAVIVEKDFWVCWTLKELFRLPTIGEHLIFKGGTSLAKVFKVIERFSEDIDVSIDRGYLGFGGTNEPEAGTSNKERHRRIEALKAACQRKIATELFPALEAAIASKVRVGEKWSLGPDTDDPDRQTLLFDYLTDIPFYWPQMQANGLPRFQYTIRELSCGAQFLAYSNELSKTYATFAVDRFLQHLKNHRLDTSRIVITTDLGCEFDGDTTHYQAGSFHETIEEKFQAQHRFNPPACPNANADVESVHNTVETELFDAQVFSSKADFFAKTATYQLWYNAARKNSSRGYKSPADLLAIKAPQISPKIFLLHPIPLESLLPHKGGHDVPRRPGCARNDT